MDRCRSLRQVASLEGVELSPAVAVGLAEAADGDLRSALQAAHMQCVLQRAAAAAAERGDGDGDGEDRPGAGRGKGGGKKQVRVVRRVLRDRRAQGHTMRTCS